MLLAATVPAVLASTTVDASAGFTCAHEARFMVTLKTGVYRYRNDGGELDGFIKYKYPGDIVSGTSLSGGRTLVVRLGNSNDFALMRGDKAVLYDCV